MMAKTSTGFEYELPENLADDFEYLEAIRKTGDNPIYTIDVAKILLGDEGYERLKEHCRVDGRVSTEKIFAEVTEISNDDSNLKK